MKMIEEMSFFELWQISDFRYAIFVKSRKLWWKIERSLRIFYEEVLRDSMDYGVSYLIPRIFNGLKRFWYKL